MFLSELVESDQLKGDCLQKDWKHQEFKFLEDEQGSVTRQTGGSIKKEENH